MMEHIFLKYFIGQYETIYFVSTIVLFRELVVCVLSIMTVSVFSNPDFQMFTSMLDHKDLLFQDSTVRLMVVPESKQSYQEYLGESFLRAMERMESIDTITSKAPSSKRATVMTIMFWSVIGVTLIL